MNTQEMQKPAKVKIVETGWDRYNGYLCGGIMFEDGQSVETLSPREIDMLASAMRVETVDGDQLGIASRMVGINEIAAEVVKSLKEQEAERVAEKEAARAEAEAIRQKALKNVSRNELDRIATNRGLKGLREIGDQLGAKGRGMEELIDNILARQVAIAEEEGKAQFAKDKASRDEVDAKMTQAAEKAQVEAEKISKELNDAKAEATSKADVAKAEADAIAEAQAVADAQAAAEQAELDAAAEAANEQAIASKAALEMTTGSPEAPQAPAVPPTAKQPDAPAESQ